VATVASGKPAGWRSTAGGEYLAEFLGTFVLIMFGDGVVAMAVAALNGSGRAATKTTIFLASGDWLLIVFGWAFAVMMGVYVAGGVTGAHINPAITLANALRRQFPWAKVPGYVLAQVAGAFVAAFFVWLVYKNAIDAYLGATHAVKKTSVATYSIFATFPAPYYHSIGGPILDEIVGTFLLVLVVFAVSDEFNLAPQGNLGPIVVGLSVGAIGASFGANTGYAINPARDFGPRLFAWIAGWGKLALPGNYGNISGYFWIPIVAPLIGGAIACYVYDFGIRDILVARGQEPTGGAGAGATEAGVRESPQEGGAGFGGTEAGVRESPRDRDDNL
jgi:glycerol uptake facilitator protein